MFDVTVTADITADEAITLEELETIIKTALDSQRIDDLIVKRDKSYSLIPIQGNYIRQYLSSNKVHFNVLQKSNCVKFCSAVNCSCFGFDRLLK